MLGSEVLDCTGVDHALEYTLGCRDGVFVDLARHWDESNAKRKKRRQGAAKAYPEVYDQSKALEIDCPWKFKELARALPCDMLGRINVVF